VPDEAARFANKLKNAEKEAWLRVAEEWLRLAMTVENRR
jgi:hypothetical protein